MEKVCAIVVTYNRKELLCECVNALLNQTRRVEHILIVDNASTDGTPETLAREFPAEKFPQIESLRLPTNTGGAGGFHDGMEEAARQGHAWLWLMDDDTIPQPNALEQLFAGRDRFPAHQRPDLLVSKAVWTDGSLHPMNTPWAKEGDAANAYLAAECATLSLRTATFVSFLVHRRCIEQYGLPIADYFIWGDDVEYAARILRNNVGVLVPASVVVHKSAQKYGSVDASPARFYYHVRNELWMLTRSPAWTRNERLRRFASLARHVVEYLKRRRFETAALAAIARGVWHALTRRPL